jgi:SpoU rRNA methylase family enzyme
MSYILLSSFSAYALEQTIVKEQIPVSIIDMTSTDQDGIVKNALICSLSAEKAAKYYLYEGYKIDTLETHIKKSESIALLGLGIKKLKLSLMGSNDANYLEFIEESYGMLKVLETHPYDRDSMILVQDLTSAISMVMRDIAFRHQTDQHYSKEIESTKIRINMVESTRLYMIYQSKNIKYDHTEEMLIDAINLLENQFEFIEKQEKYAEKDLDQMSQIWSNIKEIYADRDEGNLMLEAIEETEYLEKYLL